MSRPKPSKLRMAIRRVERTIVAIHRWLGIFACLFFAVWFVSGLVMVYVSYPRLTDAEHLERLPLIAWERVRTNPAAALAATGESRFPQDLRLEMSGERPVYQITGWDGVRRAVYADDGSVLRGLDAATATRVARAYDPSAEPRWRGLISRDQWSFPERLNAFRPFHRFSLQDPAGTEIYVSDRTGAVVLDTDRRGRFWNWIGGIPHLIDLQEVRARPQVWRPVMLLLTSVSIVVVLAGAYLGLVRLGLRRRYAGNAITPYRGWMKWHHLLGVFGGVFLIAWVVSSWIYLRPAHLLERKPIPARTLMAYVGHEVADFPASSAAAMAREAQRVRFIWVGGVPRIIYERHGAAPLAVNPADGRPAPLSPAEITAAARELAPGSDLAAARLLTTPDEYWHSFGVTSRKLPMIRLEFDNPTRNWFHIDPDTGEVVNTLSQDDRVFRWVFNGLHRLDFLALQKLGLFRHLVVWALLCSGLVLSVSAAVIGWRHLRKPRRRSKPKLKPASQPVSRDGAPPQDPSRRSA